MSFEEWWEKTGIVGATAEMGVLRLRDLCRDAWKHGSFEELVAVWKVQADRNEKPSEREDKWWQKL